MGKLVVSEFVAPAFALCPGVHTKSSHGTILSCHWRRSDVTRPSVTRGHVFPVDWLQSEQSSAGDEMGTQILPDSDDLVFGFAVGGKHYEPVTKQLVW